jgi:hypothetical protein
MPPRLEPGGPPTLARVDLDELVEVRAVAHERGEAALDRHRDARRRERAAQGPQARRDVHDVAHRRQLDDEHSSHTRHGKRGHGR